MLPEKLGASSLLVLCMSYAYSLHCDLSSIHEVVSSCTVAVLRAIHILLDSYPRSEEDEKNSKNVWLKGHTGALLC